MNYDEEKRNIFETMISEINKAYAEPSKGKDGIGVQLAREATERYNYASLCQSERRF